MFGDITQVDTTGASQKTASQNQLTYSGVPASERIAERDEVHVRKYIDIISQVAKETGVDSCVLCGIMSRESRGDIAVLTKDGFGYDGCGFGLMQVDKRYHTLHGGPDSIEHIRQAAGILIEKIRAVQGMHANWTKNQVLKGGIAAYNMGEKNVRTLDRMDVGSAGGDYSSDVVARSIWFKRNGF